MEFADNGKQVKRLTLTFFYLQVIFPIFLQKE